MYSKAKDSEFTKQLKAELTALGLDVILTDHEMEIREKTKRFADDDLDASLIVTDTSRYEQFPAGTAALYLAQIYDPDHFMPSWEEASRGLTVQIVQEDPNQAMHFTARGILAKARLQEFFNGTQGYRTSSAAESRQGMLQDYLAGTPREKVGEYSVRLCSKLKNQYGQIVTVPASNRMAQSLLHISPYKDFIDLLRFARDQEEAIVSPKICLTQTDILTADSPVLGIPVPGESAVLWAAQTDEPLPLFEAVRCKAFFPHGCTIYPITSSLCLTADKNVPTLTVQTMGNLAYNRLKGHMAVRAEDMELPNGPMLSCDTDGKLTAYASLFSKRRWQRKEGR